MTLLQKIHTSSTTDSAMARLQQFTETRRACGRPAEDLETFEKELHEVFVQAECEILAEELARHDLDVPLVVVNDEVYRRAIRCEETYTGASGPIRVIRTLYRKSPSEGPCICPMELKAGIVEGRWTPLAARQAAWAVAHLTPGEGEELFVQLGGMKPSKSSLDRLPKMLGGRWEKQRESFEEILMVQENVPQEAVSMAVSLDGVMLPMRDGGRREVRAKSEAQGKHTRGPAGHREVGCGTISFYDKDAERLSTIRLARMPCRKKKELKKMLAQEAELFLLQRPDLTLVKLADGARDNWTFLSKELPEGLEAIDFFHAAEHLYNAFVIAYGEASAKCRGQFRKYRHILREDLQGVDKVIRALRYLHQCYPKRKKIKVELRYFRANRSRMKYAELAAMNLPIGTGVTEAACKTLVTQRMKRSGMRWRHEGGQSILTFRSLLQSGRFEKAWELLADTYKKTVSLPENVLPFTDRRLLKRSV